MRARNAYPCSTCYSRAICQRGESACGDWWQWFRQEWRRVTGPFRELVKP